MMLTISLVATAFVLAGAGYAVTRARSGSRATYHYYRCPGCTQKMRYQAERAGRTVLCPRCRRQWILPKTPQELEPVSPGSSYRVGALSNRP